MIPGWHPSYMIAARKRAEAAGVRYATVAPRADVPPAFSLSDKRLRHLEQGQAGTCWVHSAVQLAEVAAEAAGAESFPVCRRLVGWAGKQLEGGGNPSDGGAVSDALATLIAGQGGYGAAHESLAPYTDDASVLGQRPTQAVLDDAKAHHLATRIDVTSDDAARTLIAAGKPVGIGIWWPYGWDDQKTFMTSVGPGVYGHALTKIGDVTAGVWDSYPWWQIDNWHGLLYPALADDHAAKVPGYKPIGDMTSDFWARADVLQAVIDYGNAERVSATGLDGYDLLNPGWGDRLL